MQQEEAELQENTTGQHVLSTSRSQKWLSAVMDSAGPALGTGPYGRAAPTLRSANRNLKAESAAASLDWTTG